MASAKTLDRISAIWSMATWATLPHACRTDEAKEVAEAEMERVKALCFVARELSDRKIAEQFPEYRNRIFTVADLRRIGFTEETA